MQPHMGVNISGQSAVSYTDDGNIVEAITT